MFSNSFKRILTKCFGSKAADQPSDKKRVTIEISRPDDVTLVIRRLKILHFPNGVIELDSGGLNIPIVKTGEAYSCSYGCDLVTDSLEELEDDLNEIHQKVVYDSIISNNIGKPPYVIACDIIDSLVDNSVCEHQFYVDKYHADEVINILLKFGYKAKKEETKETNRSLLYVE